MAAVEAGAEYVDGSLKSLGGGAGNTQSETLIAALKRGGYPTTVDLFGILDAAAVLEEEIKTHPNLAQMPKPTVDNDAILMGYACVYGGYILPIKKACHGIRLRPAEARASPGRAQGRGDAGRCRDRGSPAPCARPDRIRGRCIPSGAGLLLARR